MNKKNVERELAMHLKHLGESQEIIAKYIEFIHKFITSLGCLEEFGIPESSVT